MMRLAREQQHGLSLQRAVRTPVGGRWWAWPAAAAIAVVLCAGQTGPVTWGVAEAQMVPAPPKLNLEGGWREPQPEETRDLELVEKPGERAAVDVALRDEQGRAVRLSDYLEAGRPVILNLGYYGCPMLCGQVIRGLTTSLRDLEERDAWAPGVNYEVVTISFDEREGPDLAREAKREAMRMFSHDAAGEGWHFLTGEAEAVRAIADSVGFPYRWSERAQQYVHPAAVVLLTPDGRVARYLYGVSFPSTTMRLSLVEASEGKVGTTIDRVLLFCFQYDAEHGRYTLVAMNLMRLAGALTVVVLAVAIGVMSLRGARRQGEKAEQTRETPQT